MGGTTTKGTGVIGKAVGGLLPDSVLDVRMSQFRLKWHFVY
jgi:hypothetical protein